MRDEDLETLLAAARPTPPDEFVDQLERRLLARAPSRRGLRRRPLAVGIAAVAATLGVIIAVILAGANPLGSDSTVRATDDCRVELVPTTVRVPVVVTSASGRERIVFRSRPGTRPVTRCGAAGGRSTVP